MKARAYSNRASATAFAAGSDSATASLTACTTPAIFTWRGTGMSRAGAGGFGSRGTISFRPIYTRHLAIHMRRQRAPLKPLIVHQSAALDSERPVSALQAVLHNAPDSCQTIGSPATRRAG